jgi:hypothetical protein
MKKNVRFLGLDVPAETIAVAIAEPDGEVHSLGTIANRADSIRKMIKKLGPSEQLKACYEAGPTGYVLYWQLTELGVACEVIAPTLVPMRAGDRVKTDRRDAERLARSYRCGDLTAVWVPDESKHEGESSYALCDRLSRTRDTSQRQLPTDQDYAVSTREYQTDQSSLKAAPAAAGPAFEQRQQRKQKNNPIDVQALTGSLHIRAFSLHLLTLRAHRRWLFLEEKATLLQGFCIHQKRKCCRRCGVEPFPARCRLLL